MTRIIINFIVLFSTLLPIQAQVNDWPVFRGKSSLSGFTDSDIPSSPKLLWKISTENRSKSSPVLSDGIIYFGDEKGAIYAVSADGIVKWKSETGSPAEAPPLVFSGKVIVGSADGILRAFNKVTGKPEWSYKTEGKIAGSANVWESGSRSGVVTGSYDYYLHCVDPGSGKPLWKLETLNYINGTPSIFGNKVVFGGCDGIIRIADVLSGKETDTINIGVYIAASPSISSGRAYFGDYDGKLYCVDLKARKIDWEVSASESAGPITGIPAAGTSSVVIGNDDKYIYCFNINTGVQSWRFRTNGSITGSAVISSSRVLFGSTDGYIYLLNLSDGKKIWSFNAGAPVSSSPIVTRDNFYFLTEDGRLLAFGQK